jgi:hypothetical protein
VKSEQVQHPIIGSRYCISTCIYDSNTIPTAMPTFSGSVNTKRLVGILSDIWVKWKSKMVVINRKYIGNDVIVVRTHDDNDVLRAKHMFSGSGNTARRLWRLLNVVTYEELKMTSVKRKSLWIMFDSPSFHSTRRAVSAVIQQWSLLHRLRLLSAV